MGAQVAVDCVNAECTVVSVMLTPGGEHQIEPRWLRVRMRLRLRIIEAILHAHAVAVLCRADKQLANADTRSMYATRFRWLTPVRATGVAVTDKQLQSTRGAV